MASVQSSSDRCAVCARELVRGSRGRPRRYCGGACRQAALVRRKRGVPENLPRGGPRGTARFTQSDVARWGRRIAIERALRSQPRGSGSDLTGLEARREVMDWWRRVDQDLAGVPHALIGAAASNAYMAPRLTHDLDMAVVAADVARAEELLTARGYERAGELTMSLDPELAGSQWRTPIGEHVDLIGIGHPWAPRALAEAEENRWQGLPVLPLRYLVLMKLISSRAVDTGDLQRMLGAASEEQWTQVRALVARELPRDLDDLEALRQIGLWERGPISPGATSG